MWLDNRSGHMTDSNYGLGKFVLVSQKKFFFGVLAKLLNQGLLSKIKIFKLKF